VYEDETDSEDGDWRMRLETLCLVPIFVDEHLFLPFSFLLVSVSEEVPAVMLPELLHVAHLRCQMGNARGALSRQQWDLLEGMECSIRKDEQAFRFSEQPSVSYAVVVVKLAMVCYCTMTCWC
jgi:hypothetical protein